MRSPTDPVEDDEVLYRSIQIGKNHLTEKDGVKRISSMAFADSAFQPSVDRAILLGGDPNKAQFRANDAVLELLADQVRCFDADDPGKAAVSQKNHVMIVADPRPSDPVPRPAHAYIALVADRFTKSKFERLKTWLADVMEERWSWAIPPTEWN